MHVFTHLWKFSSVVSKWPSTSSTDATRDWESQMTLPDWPAVEPLYIAPSIALNPPSSHSSPVQPFLETFSQTRIQLFTMCAVGAVNEWVDGWVNEWVSAVFQLDRYNVLCQSLVSDIKWSVEELVSFLFSLSKVHALLLSLSVGGRSSVRGTNGWAESLLWSHFPIDPIR